jgi:hypothetical protein
MLETACWTAAASRMVKKGRQLSCAVPPAGVRPTCHMFLTQGAQAQARVSVRVKPSFILGAVMTRSGIVYRCTVGGGGGGGAGGVVYQYADEGGRGGGGGGGGRWLSRVVDGLGVAR